jgi:hypothetical protein
MRIHQNVTKPTDGLMQTKNIDWTRAHQRVTESTDAVIKLKRSIGREPIRA